MEHFRTLTTKEKCLVINLDRNIYGSFAEIGAGQEVAANFFKAGGASGSVAKTMSAYDMSFSDAIYGKIDRYVCEERLMLMLDKEYTLLVKRLPKRATHTMFFALANTVETLNYARTNQGHGWMGFRFQLTPQSPPNECVIHMMLHDNDPLLQQQVLGIVGVNLMYGCTQFEGPEKLINSLVDNLLSGRVEIDMFRLDGPNFEHVDNRLMALKLVKNGLTNAAIFDPAGNVLQPSEALYKKNVLVLRGRFRPPTLVNIDMLECGLKQFEQESDVEKKDVRVLSELTLHDLKADGEEIDEEDFLHRADILCSLGQHVMISNHTEHYRLMAFLTRFTRGKKIGVIIGIHNLHKIFDEKFYEDLKGGILESFGRLFGSNVKMFVYPAKSARKGEFDTCADLELAPHLQSLFKYLVDNEKMADIIDFNPKNLHIISDIVLAMIKSGEYGWGKMVPKKIAEAIMKEGLFNYAHAQKHEEEEVAAKS